jgi:pimeloyl-ACP methyl ester carboxylesterase
MGGGCRHTKAAERSLGLLLAALSCCAGLLGLLWLISAWRTAGHEKPVGASAHQLQALELFAIDEQPKAPDGTIVLIHGIGGSIDDWNGLRALLREDLRVVTVERPGNGWSSAFHRPPDDYLAANTQALWALLANLDVRDPILVGWSYGGAVALGMAVEAATRE